MPGGRFEQGRQIPRFSWRIVEILQDTGRRPSACFFEYLRWQQAQQQLQQGGAFVFGGLRYHPLLHVFEQVAAEIRDGFL